jgi:hypothetical protein
MTGRIATTPKDRNHSLNSGAHAWTYSNNARSTNAMSRPTGRVRSWWELTGLQPDAGTIASGQFCSASGHCFVGALLRLDQHVRSVMGPARPVSATVAVSSA